jgi:hypothetical protein
VRPLEIIEHDLKPLTTADVFMMSVGAHAIRRLPYAEFKKYVGSIAAMLAASPAITLWRTSVPVAEHYLRVANASRFFSDGHFQVGWPGLVGGRGDLVGCVGGPAWRLWLAGDLAASHCLDWSITLIPRLTSSQAA